MAGIFYYYQKQQLQAVRLGKWKYHLPLSERIKGPHLPDTEVEEARFDMGDWGYEGRNLRPAGIIDEPFPRLLNQ